MIGPRAAPFGKVAAPSRTEITIDEAIRQVRPGSRHPMGSSPEEATWTHLTGSGKIADMLASR